MRRLIEYLVTINYVWYNHSDRSKSIAYESAIMHTVFIFYINIFTIYSWISYYYKGQVSIPFLDFLTDNELRLFFALIFIILCFLISFIVPKKKINNKSFVISEIEKKKTIYLIINAVSLFLFILNIFIRCH